MGQKKNKMKIESYEQEKQDLCGLPICLLRML